MTRKEFVTKYGNQIAESVRGTGIFPSVKIAQTIIESSDSKGNVMNGITARLLNNLYGIKAEPSYKGKKALLSTPNDAKKQNYFRQYNNISDSINDHTQFLLLNSRYKTNGVFNAKTPFEQSQLLENAGYAESKMYNETIDSVIKALNLTTFDKVAIPVKKK